MDLTSRSMVSTDFSEIFKDSSATQDTPSRAFTPFLPMTVENDEDVIIVRVLLFAARILLSLRVGEGMVV